ncbi:PP2C family protein-serine/threonine phosphatase [Vibrio sp. 10N]|uniref:PP2C family protein-serine/threonine phosphatase n=1 Tax=Vibrio sp. 10N TaxID=3058938 RepID=UPI002813BD7C|nr:protein phosphatase 2C domain-containing protein [Vibrio sp. 10N]
MGNQHQGVVFSSFVKSHPGKVRPHNEDRASGWDESGVWVVADGMGGHEAGDIASQMVVDGIEEYLDFTPSSLVDSDGLIAALERINLSILEYSQRCHLGKTVGTTVVVLLIKEGLFHCLWLGDSRMYLMRHGHFARKTRDHSQVMEMVDQGLIQERDAENHPLSNVITRALGVSSDLVVSQVSGQLLIGDVFLLCSDGLTKELSDNEIAKCLSANDITESGLAMMHSALVKGASDNVSCVVTKVELEPLPNTRNRDDDTVPVFAHRS